MKKGIIPAVAVCLGAILMQWVAGIFLDSFILAAACAGCYAVGYLSSIAK